MSLGEFLYAIQKKEKLLQIIIIISSIIVASLEQSISCPELPQNYKLSCTHTHKHIDSIYVYRLGSLVHQMQPKASREREREEGRAQHLAVAAKTRRCCASASSLTHIIHATFDVE